jgi:Predicted metal-binding integral membrane protein (DUF2182)
MSHWRRGSSGAFVMGLESGSYYVGCCWALMLLLFAGGVMNLTVIAALTAFVAFEKLALFGKHGARIRPVCPEWTSRQWRARQDPNLRSPGLEGRCSIQLSCGRTMDIR